MDEIESDSDLSASGSARTGLSEFEPELRRAGELLRQNDLNGAFALLSRLEASYLRGAEVFLLLGEVLHRLGQTSRAARYRTLHDILRANFGIIDDGEARAETREILEFQHATDTSISFPEEPLGTQAGLREENETALEPFVPLTAAMAEELIRQGHHKRALEIYDRLLARNPEDAALLEAKNLAKRKAHEKRVLGVFEVWLKNIQRMKGELTGEA